MPQRRAREQMVYGSLPAACLLPKPVAMKLPLICALFFAALHVMPAQARWAVAETQHFRIWSEQKDARLREDAAMLEDYHQLLEQLTGRSWPRDAPRLDIYVVPGLREMRIVSPELGKDVAGFYSASPGKIAAFSSRAGEAAFARQVLLHEHAHHFMMQVSPTAMPAWYVEGFAEYMMTAEFRPDRVSWGKVNGGRAWQLTEGAWLPLEMLLDRYSRVDPDAFYAQSWLLTNYLYRTEGMGPKLQAYLGKVAAGGDPLAAFKSEIDPDLEGFQRKLRSYINGRSRTYSHIRRAPPEALPMQVTLLPESADEMLLPLVSMQFPQAPETDARSLKTIRAEAAKYPGDAWAERALAIAEAIAGDPQRAASLLDAALAKSPADPVLLRWRASLYKPFDPATPKQDVDAARRLFVRAFKADPQDWLTLRDYVRAIQARDPNLQKDQLDVLLTAYKLAPQVSDLAMQTGDALARAGRYREAWIAMAPIVYDPHLRNLGSGMQAYMSALQAGDGEKVKRILAEGTPALVDEPAENAPEGEDRPDGKS